MKCKHWKAFNLLFYLGKDLEKYHFRYKYNICVTVVNIDAIDVMQTCSPSNSINIHDTLTYCFYFAKRRKRYIQIFIFK